MKCIFCKQKIKGFGNNAEPVAEGICCDRCNIKKVIPFRLKRLLVSRCVNCGATNNLTTHHIDENPRNDINRNLMTLCRTCHDKVHGTEIKESRKNSRTQKGNPKHMKGTRR